MQFYAYVGDVKKLKTIGYEFQKLYASNYKSYSKNKIIMFVISKMVIEISNQDSEARFKIIDFILKNKKQPKSFWAEDRIIDTTPPIPYPDAPTMVMTGFGNIMPKKEYDISRIAYMKEVKKILVLEEEKSLSDEEIKTLHKDLNKTEFASEAYLFKLDFVNDIIDLDNLHPLEIITRKVEN